MFWRLGECMGEPERRTGEGRADWRTGVGGSELEWEDRDEDGGEGDDGGGRAVEMASGTGC